VPKEPAIGIRAPGYPFGSTRSRKSKMQWRSGAALALGELLRRQLHGQQLVQFERAIGATGDMVFDQRPRRSCAVESQLRTLDGTLDKFAERPFVPRPKVVKLMPAEKQPLEAQRPENAIDLHQALWHSI